MKIFQKNLLATYFTIALLALGSSPAFAGVFISIGLAPPPLPYYEQPACPYDGYIWTPGYWAYGDYGYYWVPGTWVQPPQFGLFWTPPYWGWNGNAYAFNTGYWGQNVGYYGGINYGYGYGGNGYGGGRWQGRHFFYNTAVNNVSSTNFHHTYVNGAVAGNNTSNVSYNGGSGGVQAQPTAQQRQFSSERHHAPTSLQQAHVRAASQDRGQLATVNDGRPATLAAARPQAYTSVAQQHAKAQPLTSQDRPATASAVSAKSGTQASSSPQIKTAEPTRLASQNTQAAASHATAVKPQSQPAVTHAALPSHPVAQAAPQSHPVTHVAPQSHPVAHAAPQSHPVAHAAPQSHPAAHAAPQSHPAVHAKT
jgi:hypothetical protein